MGHDQFATLYESAKQALAAGDAFRARDFYLQALALQNSDPGAHYGLATASYLLRNWEEAARHFAEVVRLQPDRASAYINLGAVYKQLDRLDEAITAMRRGIQLDPGRAEGFHNLAAIYRRAGKNDLAIEAYSAALRLDSRMFDAHYFLGVIYQEKNDLERAATHFRHALEIRPDWDKPQQALAQIEAAATSAEPAPVQPPSIDPDALVDPEVHGEALQAIHQAAIDLQNESQEFLNTMRKEVEPAILELSKRLLDRKSTSADVQDCVTKLESAMARMRLAEGASRQRIERLQAAAERLLPS